VQSNFSQVTKEESDTTSQKSGFGGIGFASKSKMSKKDLAAFMKEKLALTKIASEVKT
jgi:hypothetical protein